MLKIHDNLYKMSTKESEEKWKHLLEGPYCARHQPLSRWIMEKLGKGGFWRRGQVCRDPGWYLGSLLTV